MKRIVTILLVVFCFFCLIKGFGESDIGSDSLVLETPASSPKQVVQENQAETQDQEQSDSQTEKTSFSQVLASETHEPHEDKLVEDNTDSEEGKIWKKIFPDALLDGDGKKVSVDCLKGKLVGIYFSAFWCPPCRSFTPRLVNFRNSNAKEFEVVFVSSDKDLEAQLEYMKKAQMTWPGVRHSSLTAKVLSETYQVEGIPTLIILSENGKLISKSGREEVSNSADTCLENWKALKGK